VVRIDGYALCGDYATANAQADELIALADERESPYWKASGTAVRGWVFALTGRTSDAVRAITSGIALLRSTGASLYEPAHLRHLAMAYAELGALDDAWRCIDDAIEKVERSREKWSEAEVLRIAGKIALKSPQPTRRKRKRISSARSQLQGSSKLSPGNCAPQ
jgi:predicted ATPase